MITLTSTLLDQRHDSLRSQCRSVMSYTEQTPMGTSRTLMPQQRLNDEIFGDLVTSKLCNRKDEDLKQANYSFKSFKQKEQGCQLPLLDQSPKCCFTQRNQVDNIDWLFKQAQKHASAQKIKNTPSLVLQSTAKNSERQTTSVMHNSQYHSEYSRKPQFHQSEYTASNRTAGRGGFRPQVLPNVIGANDYACDFKPKTNSVNVSAKKNNQLLKILHSQPKYQIQNAFEKHESFLNKQPDSIFFVGNKNDNGALVNKNARCKLTELLPSPGFNTFQSNTNQVVDRLNDSLIKPKVDFEAKDTLIDQSIRSTFDQSIGKKDQVLSKRNLIGLLKQEKESEKSPILRVESRSGISVEQHDQQRIQHAYSVADIPKRTSTKSGWEANVFNGAYELSIVEHSNQRMKNKASFSQKSDALTHRHEPSDHMKSSRRIPDSSQHSQTDLMEDSEESKHQSEEKQRLIKIRKNISRRPGFYDPNFLELQLPQQLRNAYNLKDASKMLKVKEQQDLKSSVIDQKIRLQQMEKFFSEHEKQRRKRSFVKQEKYDFVKAFREVLQKQGKASFYQHLPPTSKEFNEIIQMWTNPYSRRKLLNEKKLAEQAPHFEELINRVISQIHAEYERVKNKKIKTKPDEDLDPRAEQNEKARLLLEAIQIQPKKGESPQKAPGPKTSTKEIQRSRTIRNQTQIKSQSDSEKPALKSKQTIVKTDDMTTTIEDGEEVDVPVQEDLAANEEDEDKSDPEEQEKTEEKYEFAEGDALGEQALARLQLEELQKEKFFDDIAASEVQAEADPTIMNNKIFAQECTEYGSNVFPLPAKLVDGSFSLQGMQMNLGIATALGNFFRRVVLEENQLKELSLDGNNLHDKALSQILKGIQDQQILSKLRISKNEIGAAAAQELASILAWESCSLKELVLKDIKTSEYHTAVILEALSENVELEHLEIQGIKLNKPKLFESLFKFLKKNKVLKHLTLRWVTLFPNQMSVLVQTLTTKKKLYYLNLSYNNMLDTTQNRANVKAFCKGIRRVLKKTRIFHLDLSHMNLGSAARKFGESFRNSSTLCSVHLSGNGIPSETVSYLDSLLRIPDLPQITNFLAGRLNTCQKKLLQVQSGETVLVPTYDRERQERIEAEKRRQAKEDKIQILLVKLEQNVHLSSNDNKHSYQSKILEDAFESEQEPTLMERLEQEAEKLADEKKAELQRKEVMINQVVGQTKPDGESSVEKLIYTRQVIHQELVFLHAESNQVQNYFRDVNAKNFLATRSDYDIKKDSFDVNWSNQWLKKSTNIEHEDTQLKSNNFVCSDCWVCQRAKYVTVTVDITQLHYWGTEVDRLDILEDLNTATRDFCLRAEQGEQMDDLGPIMFSSVNGWAPCHLIHAMPFAALNEPKLMNKLETEAKVNSRSRVLDFATGELSFHPESFLLKDPSSFVPSIPEEDEVSHHSNLEVDLEAEEVESKQSSVSKKSSLMLSEKISSVSEKIIEELPQTLPRKFKAYQDLLLVNSRDRGNALNYWRNSVIANTKYNSDQLMLDFPRAPEEESDDDLSDSSVENTAGVYYSALDYENNWRSGLPAQTAKKDGTRRRRIKLKNLFVWAGFVKPGLNQLYICYPDKHGKRRWYFKEIFIPPREGPIPVFEDVQLPKPAERKGHTSIWKDYKFDPVSNAAAIAHDTNFWKVHRFVKDPKELAACIEMVKEYFEPIKEIHTHLAAKSTFPSMDKISFEAFCKDIRILGKHVNAPALDRVFIVVNVEIEEQSENPANELIRFELTECLLRIADIKYRQGLKQKFMSQAFKTFMEEHVMSFYERTCLMGNKWRNKIMRHRAIDDLLFANKAGLEAIFLKDFVNKPSNKTFRDVAREMAKQLKLRLEDQDVNYCFNMSHMTIAQENDFSQKYEQLSFVEFLEFIVRLINMKLDSMLIIKAPDTAEDGNILEKDKPRRNSKQLDQLYNDIERKISKVNLSLNGSNTLLIKTADKNTETTLFSSMIAKKAVETVKKSKEEIRFDKHMGILELMLKKTLVTWFRKKDIDYVDFEEANLESSSDDDDGEADYQNFIVNTKTPQKPDLLEMLASRNEMTNMVQSRTSSRNSFGDLEDYQI